MKSNKIKILKTGVYLVETEEGMRLFSSFDAAKVAAQENNAIIVCGGAV